MVRATELSSLRLLTRSLMRLHTRGDAGPQIQARTEDLFHSTSPRVHHKIPLSLA